MMKRFAVAYINFYNNELEIEIVEAEDWQRAVFKHSKLNTGDFEDWKQQIPETLEELKNQFFDIDSMLDVIEIPS